MTKKRNSRHASTLLITSDERIRQEFDRYNDIPEMTAAEFFSKENLGVAYELQDTVTVTDGSTEDATYRATHGNQVQLKAGEILVLQASPAVTKVEKVKSTLANMAGAIGNFPLMVLNAQQDSNWVQVKFISPKINKLVSLNIAKHELPNKEKWGMIFKVIAGNENVVV